MHFPERKAPRKWSMEFPVRAPTCEAWEFSNIRTISQQQKQPRLICVLQNVRRQEWLRSSFLSVSCILKPWERLMSARNADFLEFHPGLLWVQAFSPQELPGSPLS